MTQKTVILLSGTSWTVPDDWTDANTIEVWAAGGGGAGVWFNNLAAGGGGGGGAYSKVSNLSLTKGIAISIAIGIGGAGGAHNVAGSNGGDTWFNGTSLATSSVGAQGGFGSPLSSEQYGAGGAASSGVGDVKYSGGDGGATLYTGGGGGGGAASPTGNGSAGGTSNGDGGAGGGGSGGASSTAGTSNSGGTGGTGGTSGGGTTGGGPGAPASGGNNGSGGGGGNTSSSGSGGAGGAGSTVGSGGGGGGAGCWADASHHGGRGGDYGGGGGGSSISINSVNSAGSGAPGRIVITYEANLIFDVDDVTVGSPQITPVVFSIVRELSTSGLTVSAPVIAAPVFYIVDAATGADLVISSPDLGTPTVTETQLVQAESLTIGRPVLGRPWAAPPPYNFIYVGDRHIRRSGKDYAYALAALLPTGIAWSRAASSTLMRVVSGLAMIFGYVDGRAADLLEVESDPRLTLELLPDWERNWGLPDACLPEPQTIPDRRNTLVSKMTLMGAQSRAFFIDAAYRIGYDNIYITEYAPFMCGISQVGDTRDDHEDYRWYIGEEEMRFYWTVHIADARLTWFRAAAGQLGVDHHLEIGLAEDLECLLNRWKPAQTQIVFDYSDLESGGSMAGTP